ncbi:MAG: hypothetical protein Q9195_004153 [Heterodermia aff. obscurata]
MADEILLSLEPVIDYASRIPLPDNVSRSSLRSDRLAELEDVDHTRPSSLDALQRVPLASSAFLPDSGPAGSLRLSRSAEPGNSEQTRHSSLDALERLPLYLCKITPRNPAGLTTLRCPTGHGIPPEDTAGYDQSPNRKSRVSIGPDVTNDSDEVAAPSFAEKVRVLQQCLPHLENIKHPSRRRDARIECYDFSKGSAVSTWHARFRSMLDGFFADDDTPLSRLLGEQPQSCVDLRLIVAEDLSSDLIEQLGSLLDISPEPFEEHLLDSGWRSGVKTKQGADSWVTQGMHKDYLTVKWYRPVKRQFLRPNKYERVELLDPYRSQEGLKWDEEIKDDRGKLLHLVRHSARPWSNIFRNEWDIHAGTIETKNSCKTVAWEEQATIWSRKEDFYRTVLVILDPLPTVRHFARGAESALRILGLSPPSEISTPIAEVRALSETRLPSTAVSLPTTVAGRSPRSVSPQGSTFVRPRLGKRFELLSFPRYLIDLFRGNTRTPRSQSQHQGYTDPEDALGIPGYICGQSNTQSHPQRSPSRLSGESNQPRQTLTNESRELSEVDEDVSEQVHDPGPKGRSIFYGAFPRGPLLDYTSMMSFNNLTSSNQQLNTETSTAVDLATWIRAYPGRQGNTAAHSGPLDFLFAIVQKDTLSTLQLMDQALTQIGRDSLDDNLIQQRLTTWRLLLERIQTDLRSLDKSLSKFAIFTATLQTPSSDDEGVGTTPSPLVVDLLREAKIEITNLRHRTTSSYQTLMANMSIVDSKKGIAEAEGVTKLTELAFFFIPLTFSASIFSMQVKELNAADISIYAFVVLAIIITVLSYSLRLMVRSEYFIRRRRGLTQDIRSGASLSPDASIPTSTFLVWVWHRYGWKMKIAVAIAIAIGPLVSLWTQHLTSGIKIGATIAIGILFLSFPIYLLFRAFHRI